MLTTSNWSSVKIIAKLLTVVLEKFRSKMILSEILKGLLQPSGSLHWNFRNVKIKIVMLLDVTYFIWDSIQKSKGSYKNVWSVSNMGECVTLNTCKILKIVWLTYNIMEWLLLPTATDNNIRNLWIKTGRIINWFFANVALKIINWINLARKNANVLKNAKFLHRLAYLMTN